MDIRSHYSPIWNTPVLFIPFRRKPDAPCGLLCSLAHPSPVLSPLPQHSYSQPPWSSLLVLNPEEPIPTLRPLHSLLLLPRKFLNHFGH